jgi:hypothetical protein
VCDDQTAVDGTGTPDALPIPDGIEAVEVSLTAGIACTSILGLRHVASVDAMHG